MSKLPVFSSRFTPPRYKGAPATLLFRCVACVSLDYVDDKSGLCARCWRCAVLAPAALLEAMVSK